MPTEFGLRNKEIKVTFGRRNRKSVSNFADAATNDDDKWSSDSIVEKTKNTEENRDEEGESSELTSGYVSLIKRAREHKQVTKDKDIATPTEAAKYKTTTQDTKKSPNETFPASSPSQKSRTSAEEQKNSATNSEKPQSSLEDIFASFLGNSTIELSQDSTPKNSPARSKIAHSLKRAHTDSEYSTSKPKRSNLFGSLHEDDDAHEDTWTPVIFTDRIPVRSNMSSSEISKLSVADIMKSDLLEMEVDSSEGKESNDKVDKPINAAVTNASTSRGNTSHEKDGKSKGKKSNKTYRQKSDITLESTSNLSPPTFSRAKTDLDATPRKSILARKHNSPNTSSAATLNSDRVRALAESDRRWDGDASERDLVDDVDENATDLKSQHELRELGESKRFNDEMEYVLGGLDPTQSLSVRRTSCLELARKLLSGNFSMKLRAHNFIPKIYELLREQNDSIILSCRAFMLYLLVQDKRNLEFLPLEDHCMELLLKLLTIDPDPLAQLNWGSTKSEKRLIKELREVVVASKAVLAQNSISVKSLAARALLSILSRKTRNDEVAREKVRESGILEVVCDILEQYLEPMDQQLSGLSHVKLEYEAFLESGPYLRILESATQFCPANQDVVAQYKSIFRRLLILALFFQVEVSSDNSHKVIQTMDSISGVLRLLINLTNEHEESSRLVSDAPGLYVIMRLVAFSQNNLLKFPDASMNETLSASKYDISLLAIGLLINIVDANNQCKNAIREAEFCSNESCHAQFTVTCQCSKKLALEYLIEFYIRIQNGADSTEHNVLVAYVALLLGCLMKENQSNQRFIVNLLPERSVQSLVTILEEFLQFNEMIGGGSVSQTCEFGSIAELEMAATGESPSPDKPKSIADAFNDIINFLKTLLVE
ncbi:hypothetical protein K7432_003814 [Basidiobolus ranarum]|uniref:WAPL domain-containing protein n=1 Tax=Basidiobolus ranarum TaxID=34480 RepID=A0ABR2WZ86_9FUNG